MTENIVSFKGPGEGEKHAKGEGLDGNEWG
jgi:hypothetical protein